MSAWLMAMLMVSAAGLPSWTFDSPADAQAWAPDAHLTDVAVKGGVLSARAIDWDPYFTCRGFEFPAEPWQCIRLRIKADKAGDGEIFWSGALEGQYGGLDPAKHTVFSVPGDNQWHDLVLLPFWQSEKTIRQMRLDVYDGARFEIDSIAVENWEGGATDTATVAWTFDSNTKPWTTIPGTNDRFAPPLCLDVSNKGWVTVRVASAKAGSASLLWSTPDEAGLKTEDFEVRGDNRPHTFNFEMSGVPTWQTIVALGLRLPAEAAVQSVSLSDAPSGPMEVLLNNFGFENAANRAGRECTIIAQLTNRGGESAKGLKATLNAQPPLTLLDAATQDVPRIDFGDAVELKWRVKTDAAGTYPASVSIEGFDAEGSSASLRFLPPLEATKADYVPAPRPVATTADVLAYYFPGWETDAKWDCIRRVAPIRKPLLGYYDESNPECVDWQIKWAAENGVTGFLVDWYWVAGRQHLTHWFEAYRKAHYRDQLKVAIMWANHNAPKTHSREDWRNVTKEWIDHYFNLPGYYRINGKPAVFVWAPSNVRDDLGGSAEVKAAFDESQQMAKAAGYEGIEFVSMAGARSEEGVKALHDEGYAGTTNYHEWADAGDRAPAPKHWRYQDIVDTIVPMWTKLRDTAAAAGITYYPVVETGWDARPWHGNKMQVIEGRTPERFEALLREAKGFIGSEGRPIVILGPVNEWGEGSYIEPCAEYDFGMMEAIRNVFGVGDPASWPVNVAPADVGRGPYDYPKVEQQVAWTFDKAAEGWEPMMNVSAPTCSDGALRFTTTSTDPAVSISLGGGVRSADYSKAEIKLCVKAAAPKGNAQLFWSTGGTNTSEAASISFPIDQDGELHTYTLDLGSQSRWRGRISSLRFDPTDSPNAEVALDDFRLIP
jgi:hypothetical protein